MTWDSSSQYSKDKLQSMQQEAIERVKEMQRRSNAALKNAQRDPAFYSNPQPHLSHQTQGGEPGNNLQRRSNSFPHTSSGHSTQNTYSASPNQSLPPVQVPKPPPIVAEPQQEPSHNENIDANCFSKAIPMQEEAPRAGGLGSLLSGFLSGLGLAPSPEGRDTLPKLLTALNLDHERLLILLLVFLLYNDGADYTLLFALLYLFL